jgi:hypothetical protein
MPPAASRWWRDKFPAHHNSTKLVMLKGRVAGLLHAPSPATLLASTITF